MVRLSIYYFHQYVKEFDENEYKNKENRYGGAYGSIDLCCNNDY